MWWMGSGEWHWGWALMGFLWMVLFWGWDHCSCGLGRACDDGRWPFHGRVLAIGDREAAVRSR